ncbi:MAG: flippase-like domain-containing protein [Erysipelotrichales bacterium]|nr:flippase-like domain-containing protein [Erysipelotrichales bacterium]
MNRTKQYILNLTLIFTLTFIVLYFSLKDNTDEIINIFKQLNPLLLGICIVAILIYHAIVAQILTIFARFYNPNYRFKAGFKNALIAALFHGITPFASGGQFIQAYVFYEDDIDVGESASILLMDFIVYQTTLMFYTLACVMLEWKRVFSGGSLYLLALLGFLINFLSIIGIWIVSRSIKLHKWLCENGVNIVYRLHLIKDKKSTIEKINIYLEKFNIEVKRLASKPELIIKVVVANILRLTLYFSIPILCAWTLGIPLTIDYAFESIALSAFISMINSFVPLPGASGGAEGTFVVLFATLVGRSNATCMMLVWRFVTYYFILLVGLIAYAKFKRGHKIRRIEEEIYENRIIQ